MSGGDTGEVKIEVARVVSPNRYAGYMQNLRRIEPEELRKKKK